jgi:hypothetical protein
MYAMTNGVMIDTIDITLSVNNDDELLAMVNELLMSVTDGRYAVEL